MYVYIAYRNLSYYYAQNNLAGGVLVNNDYKFTCIKDGIYYLLTQNNTNYAVSKEAGDKFIEDVLSKCTGEHKGYFPFVPSLNGKNTAAVVEMDRVVDINGYDMEQRFHYDMDDELLLQMLDELKAGSGEPLDERALMNYCYPNPVLPEGDFDLKEIYHGIYCKPDNTPNSVIRTFFPDKRASYLITNKDGAFIQMRVDDNNVISNVPAELIPEIKEKVRQLCSEPVGAYVEHGDPEGFIRFGDDDRIFINPDKALELLNEIASMSEYDKTEAVDTQKYIPVNKQPPGAFFGMAGVLGFAPINQATPAAETAAPVSRGAKCAFCGADVTGKKFCTECGSVVG